MTKNWCDMSATITTDLWTSREFGHYFKLQLNRHTRENIAETVDLDIGQAGPMLGVCDNAANMVKGVNLNILDLHTCNCHTKQLAISDTFKELHNND